MKLPGLRLRLATSQLIRQWAQRRLPNGKIISGQIFNPKTLNYQTLKPEKDGLFCERIFGPINDSICACGRPLRGQKFCPRCEVEYISTRVRRYRLGYIQLMTATAHIWFFKGRPSFLSLFLNLSKKKIEGLLYCTKNISRTLFPQELSSLNFFSIQKFQNVAPINRQAPSAPPLANRYPPRARGGDPRAKAESPVRNCVSKNLILGSFFLEKGYWHFKKIQNIGFMNERRRFIQRAIEIEKKKDRQRPRGASRNNFLGIDWTCHRARLAAGHSPLIYPSSARRERYTLGRSRGLQGGPSRKYTEKYTSFRPPQGPVGEGPKKLGKRFRGIGCTAGLFVKPAAFPRASAQSRTQFVFNEISRTHQLGGRERAFKYTDKKSRWQKGGLRDSAIYFGFSLVSKMFSWPMTVRWFSFVYFLIQSPFYGDFLNKFYPGPPGLVNFWGLESRLFCSTGVQLMRTWLTQLTQNQCSDGRLLEIQIRLDLLQLEGERTSAYFNVSENAFIQRIVLFRRFKYLRSFRHTQMNPASMILSVIPVLPPDLRPILQLDNHQMAVSDLNKLYQTVLLRNKRLARLTRLTTLDQNSHCLNSEALQYSQRLLQESVDALIDNGKVSSSRQATARQAIPLKSLSDLFKGKKGRFRQNLLGKRVDYSGRSVIVVGPFLKIYECGLPKEMAYELFQPFLLRRLLLAQQAQTVLGAKKLLQQKPLFIWNLLKEVVHSHPILLNRAPSLHRLSIQAFQPRLIEGKAILLHPLVCAAFNADFDGDQMGVHLPLCFEARGEAWKITWSQNNLFSVATGSPTCAPSQDMILGSSFLTMENTQKLSFHLLSAYFQEQTCNKFPPKKGCPGATGIVQKIFMARGSHFLKRLLFEKPYFFVKKNIHITTSSDYFEKKNHLSETTFPRSLGLSFSQNAHPFIYWNFLRPLDWWRKDDTPRVEIPGMRGRLTLRETPWGFFWNPDWETPNLSGFSSPAPRRQAAPSKGPWGSPVAKVRLFRPMNPGHWLPKRRGQYFSPPISPPIGVRAGGSPQPFGEAGGRDIRGSRKPYSPLIAGRHSLENTNNIFMRNLLPDLSVERQAQYKDCIWCSCNPSMNKFETEKKKTKTY